MEAFTFDTTEQILLAATGTLFIIQALYYLCLYNRIHLRSRAVKRGMYTSRRSSRRCRSSSAHVKNAKTCGVT